MVDSKNLMMIIQVLPLNLNEFISYSKELFENLNSRLLEIIQKNLK